MLQDHWNASRTVEYARILEFRENTGIPLEQWNTTRTLECCEKTAMPRENKLQAVHEKFEIEKGCSTRQFLI
jgi:hypothetical protein